MIIKQYTISCDRYDIVINEHENSNQKFRLEFTVEVHIKDITTGKITTVATQQDKYPTIKAAFNDFCNDVYEVMRISNLGNEHIIFDEDRDILIFLLEEKAMEANFFSFNEFNILVDEEGNHVYPIPIEE